MRYQKTRLKNGATVLCAPENRTKAVTLLILFGVGSRHESTSLNGIAHFIEHLVFKGTPKRPSTLHISQELDSMGAEYNAMTAKDFTGYYIKVSHQKMNKASDILFDMILNSLFDKKMLQQEKKVIIEEINMYEDNPLMYLGDLFEQTVYGKKSKLGQLISGPKSNIKALNRTKVLNFMKRFYHPGNMVVVGSGHINSPQLVNLTEKYISGLSQKKRTAFQKEKVTQSKPQLSLLNRKTEQVQIGLGFPAYSYFDKDIYALEVLSNILGGMMSSRLFIEIRVKRGLAYFINSSLNIYQDTGNLMIQAGLDKSRINLAIAAILDQLKIVKKEGVTVQELKKAKDNLTGKLILKIEDSESVASYLAKQYLLTKRIITPQQLIKKIKAVRQQDIKRVANDIFQNKKINLALIGPFADKSPFAKLLKID
ncbi:MAG: pitrilysin family protein [Patescibacteria group bacterium]